MTRPALAYLAAIALSAFLPAPPVAAQAPAGQAAAGDDRIVFPASVQQGAMVIGKVPPGSQVEYAGRTLRSTGLSPGMLQMWLGSWALSWVVAFPTLLLVLPLVRRATAAIVDLR